MPSTARPARIASLFIFGFLARARELSNSVGGNSEGGIHVPMDCDVSIKPQRADIAKKGSSERMKARRLPRAQGQQRWPRRKVLFFPELQLAGGFIVLKERAKLRRCFKQPNP